MLHEGLPITPALLERLEEVVNADEHPVKYLSIDPGKANGICGYDEKFYLIFMYTVPSDDVVGFLQRFKRIDLCVIEDFLLYPDKAKQQVYSDMETSRVIGRVESWAERFEVTLVKQGASIKKTGYAWIGEKPLPKTNKKNHQLDAHVHFMFWAVKNKKISAESLVRRNVTKTS